MRIFAALTIGSLAIMTMAGPAVAQSNTGSVSGQLVICRPMAMPVNEAGSGASGPTQSVPGPDLADVSPGNNLRRQLGQMPQITEPLVNIEVKVVGTPLTATTDSTGHFVLSGVPASQPLTVEAQFDPGPTLTLQAQNLIVSPGQTLDVGTLAVTGCRTIKPGRADTDWPDVIVQVTPSLDTTASAPSSDDVAPEPVTDELAQ
jgi:hypothetical protein